MNIKKSLKKIDQKDNTLQKTEMKNQTTNAIKTSIDQLKNQPNYNVKQVFGT
jgi:hypothetical protein